MNRISLSRYILPFAVAFSLGVGVIANVSAAVITSNNLLSPTTIDFSQFTDDDDVIFNATEPIQIGGLVGEDILFSGSPNSGLTAQNQGWTLAGNGYWTSGRNGYIGANHAKPGSIIITFNDGPVSGVGAFMNHAHGLGTKLKLSIFDAQNNLLERFNVTASAPIITPGGVNEGAFRGFSRDIAEIARFEISGYVPIIDDLSFTRPPGVSEVPLPAALPLFGTGLALMGFIGWRRRRYKRA